VTDNADLFTQQDLLALNERCAAIEKDTGVEVAIVTVKDTGGQDLIQYAAKTGEINGVGNAQLNNGLVILISLSNQPGWALETGRGAESTVTDAHASQFLRDADSALDSGSYYTGLTIILQDVQTLYAKQVTATPSPLHENGTGNPFKFTIILIVLLIGSAAVAAIVYIFCQRNHR
jgi:uncharacterized protein